MIWSHVKPLLLSYSIYWLFLVTIGSLGWFFFTRLYPRFGFRWQAPVLAASVLCLYLMGTQGMTLYHNSVVVNAYRQDMQTGNVSETSGRGTASIPDAKPLEPLLQKRAEFLKTVEELIQNPIQLTSDKKKKVFADYGDLFKSASDKMEAAKAIADVYKCQKFFWEDALASFHAKRPIKSEARKDCETLSGAYFNRDKLLPANLVTNNDQALKSLAERKPIPGEDGKVVEVNEKMLRDALDAQAKAIDTVGKLFN